MSEAVDALDKGKKKESVGEFIQKTREEMTRVSFPSRDDVRKTTLVVIINVIFFALFLFLVDMFWVYVLDGITWVFNKISGI
ncbi:MAG: preprotein translocase subunit SecE [Acidobacteria bacterium]|nr:preprotein translocase subunit SecE [Acidobacteriota bacterium]